MPIYAYRCPSCSEVFEENRGYDQADDLPECQKCSTTMVRNYKFAAIQFKGPGFYTTDE